MAPFYHSSFVERELANASVKYKMMNDEEQLEKSSLDQDDYKKLKQENENYRQELHVLRLKLETSNALEKELLEINEGLERSHAQHTTKTAKMLAEKDET